MPDPHLPLGRRLLKLIHPEGIPFPGTEVYNALSAGDTFQKNYTWVAKDIAGYSATGALLDIGTGPGWLLLKIHQQAPNLQLTGLDISAAMVTRARQHVADAGLSEVITVREGSASRLPWEAATFDLVVSTGSVHHWKEPVSGFNEVYRVLKPGGVALIYDMVSDTPAEVYQSAARDFGRFNILMLWLHAFEEPFYSQAAFLALGQASRFQAAQLKFVGVMAELVLRKATEKE